MTRSQRLNVTWFTFQMINLLLFSTVIDQNKIATKW